MKNDDCEIYSDMNSPVQETIILIPAYEPDKKLVSLLEEFKQQTDYSVVVVDDGSSSNAQAIFKEAGAYATVLRHSQNSGKGTAIKTGLAYIRENFSEHAVVVTVDADGQHKVADAIKLVKKAVEQRGSLIIGSRRFSGKVPLRSRFGNTITRLVYRLITRSRVKDTQTGLRAFVSDMIPFMLNIKGERYEYEMNVLLECSRHHVPVEEVWIETIYINDNATSHFNPVKDSYRIYKEIIKYCGSSLIAFGIDFAVFSLMVLLTRGVLFIDYIILSNIIARIISSSVNFYINKKYVFKNKDSLIKTAVKYFALAGAILFMNTFLIKLFFSYVIGNEFISKLIVEVTLFIISWLVQRFFVFKKEKDEGKQQK